MNGIVAICDVARELLLLDGTRLLNDLVVWVVELSRSRWQWSPTRQLGDPLENGRHVRGVRTLVSYSIDGDGTGGRRWMVKSTHRTPTPTRDGTHDGIGA